MTSPETLPGTSVPKNGAIPAAKTGPEARPASAGQSTTPPPTTATPRKSSEHTPPRLSMTSNSHSDSHTADFTLDTHDDLPTLEAIRKIDNYTVLDRDGKSHTFRSLYTGNHAAQRVLIIFIRHFLCGNCKQYLQALTTTLTPLAPRPQPLHNDLRHWLRRRLLLPSYTADLGPNQTPFPFPIYTDPTGTLYNKLGMEKRTLALGSQPKYMTKGIIRSSLESVLQGVKLIKTGKVFEGGDMKRIGGEFLFEAPGMEGGGQVTPMGVIPPAEWERITREAAEAREQHVGTGSGKAAVSETSLDGKAHRQPNQHLTFPNNASNMSTCTITGTPSLYGLGIRASFYLLWFFSLIGERCHEQHAKVPRAAELILAYAVFLGLAMTASAGLLFAAEVYIVLLLISTTVYLLVPRHTTDHHLALLLCHRFLPYRRYILSLQRLQNRRSHRPVQSLRERLIPLPTKRTPLSPINGVQPATQKLQSKPSVAPFFQRIEAAFQDKPHPAAKTKYASTTRHQIPARSPSPDAEDLIAQLKEHYLLTATTLHKQATMRLAQTHTDLNRKLTQTIATPDAAFLSQTEQQIKKLSQPLDKFRIRSQQRRADGTVQSEESSVGEIVARAEEQVAEFEREVKGLWKEWTVAEGK
ncbi:hypothetical protein N0V88_002468 [Collariella sp. IMI 366227]|nr:hypothetical protein N0V88_002468 [Collariella sp. IMI 366227]